MISQRLIDVVHQALMPHINAAIHAQTQPIATNLAALAQQTLQVNAQLQALTIQVQALVAAGGGPPGAPPPPMPNAPPPAPRLAPAGATSPPVGSDEWFGLDGIGIPLSKGQVYRLGRAIRNWDPEHPNDSIMDLFHVGATFFGVEGFAAAQIISAIKAQVEEALRDGIESYLAPIRSELDVKFALIEEQAKLDLSPEGLLRAADEQIREEERREGLIIRETHFGGE